MRGTKTLLTVGFFLAVLSLPLQPLLTGGVPWQGDGLLHVYRLAALELSIGWSDWFPRWLPVLGYGYGFPLFNYYAPFSYYAVLPLRWLGVPLPAAAGVSYLLALGLLLGSVHGWARALWGPWAGRTAVLSLAFAPYLLLNLYQRAALAEIWGLAWLAAALWAAWSLAHGRNKAWLPLILTLAGLILSHNVTALIGLPLIIFIGVSGRRSGVGERLRTQDSELRTFLPKLITDHSSLLTSLALSLLLTTFFWLPALLEQDFVQIERLVGTANFSYGNHFLALGELLARPPAADPRLINPPLPRGIGWLQLGLALLGLLAVWRGVGHKTTAGKVALLTAVCLGMTLPASALLWETLPLLPFVQFPWRFLGPAALGLALLGGAAGGLLAGRSGRPLVQWGRLGIVWLLLAGFGLPYLFPPVAPELPAAAGPADLVTFELETGWLGTTSAADYLPRGVETLPPPLPAAEPAFFAGGPAVEIDLQAAGPVSFNQFYFPGWRAWVDGQEVPVSAAAPHGLLTLDLPAGRQEVRFDFGPTPLRRGAGIGSLVGLGLVVGVFVWKKKGGTTKNTKDTKKNKGKNFGAFGVFGGLILFSLTLFTLKAGVLDRVDSPVRRSGYERVAAGPRVNIDGRLALLAVAKPEEAVAADRPLEIDLYWQGLRFDEELSVGIHLLGADGLRYGQSDRLHPADFPLTRWRPEQYARDRHLITPLPGTPPGEYRLELFVYSPVDGRRREVFGADGLPVGNRIDLGPASLGLPARFPTPEEIDPQRRLDVEPAAGVRLLGVDGPPPAAAVGEVVPLTLYWQAAAVPAGTLEGEITLVREGEVVRVFPLSAQAPDESWAPGRLQRDDYLLRLPAGLPGGKYGLRLGDVLLGEVDISEPVRMFDLPEFDITLGEAVGELAALAGATWRPCPAAQALPCEIDLVWQARAETGTAYAVFVQLLGPDGRVVAQHDAPPQHAGRPRPTTSWLPGEVLVDFHPLALPSDLPPGDYRLIAGLYDPDTGVRLPAGTGDLVEIGRFTLE